MLIALPLLAGLLIGYVLVGAFPEFQSFQQKRESVMAEMMSTIYGEVAEGNYRCCIEPPCTMCFLGEWKWDDGICRCDDLIAEGDFDNVCPQCKSLIKEGRCKSSLKDACELIE
jgi:hypothetical protein